jgi:hypothetical protein
MVHQASANVFNPLMPIGVRCSVLVPCLVLGLPTFQSNSRKKKNYFESLSPLSNYQWSTPARGVNHKLMRHSSGFTHLQTPCQGRCSKVFSVGIVSSLFFTSQGLAPLRYLGEIVGRRAPLQFWRGKLIDAGRDRLLAMATSPAWL